MASAETPAHGHTFAKKTFHKPTYCHHCTDMLWGLIQQGYICEVCNFVVHDRCYRTVVSSCSSIAATLIKNPVAHCWSEPTHHKRKFCNVCRKRIPEESLSIHCEICDYFVHSECCDFAVADCKENATYLPGKELSQVHHQHHWREGNLPSNSKCVVCKKNCWSAECLAGMKCEWCGMTSHAVCHKSITGECTFGNLEPIYLPPHAVSIPRTEVPMEAIIGVQVRRKDALSPRSISEEFSTGDTNKYREEEIPHTSNTKAKEREERDEEMIKVYDGNNSFRRRIFRVVSVSRHASCEQLLTASLRAFHITKDPGSFYLTDLYNPSNEEVRLMDPNPVLNLHKKEGKRPAIFLRFKDQDNDSGEVRVYPGKLQVTKSFVVIQVNISTTIKDLIVEALLRFGLDSQDVDDYRLSEILLDRGVTERVLDKDEKPWEIMKRLGQDSIRQMELMRFYLQLKQDPHGPNLALFVGNLPPNLSQRNYENLLTDFLGLENKFSSFGPIYYEYGSMVITYEDSEKAVRSLYILRDSRYEEKHLLVMLLPNIEPSMVPAGVQPLLVFVNVKSGGCQGLELISSFRKLLNPYQVFDLENGGPLPGLYVFRHIADYKILVCGGDGTIGWVLQCLDNVGQDSQCSSPPCAIVPLGTGNDLARVLRWGPGYTGGEDPLNLLRDVIDAEEIRLDRWTVVFYPEDKVEDKEKLQQLANSTTGTTNEDNTQIFVMNNYFGIGIDADLCLDFHNAREENPNKFNSRLHNKGVYVKMGLRKMVGRKLCKDLHKEVRLEVDGKVVDLPQVEGIIILNILSWGSGANPWGPEKEDQFSKPNHWDGMLEVVGVTGVVHLGQIQSGLRSAMRIAQGGHIKIHLNSDIPVQVDGEPWVQSPGNVVVLKSALKCKGRGEPEVAVAGQEVDVKANGPLHPSPSSRRRENLQIFGAEGEASQGAEPRRTTFAGVAPPVPVVPLTFTNRFYRKKKVTSRAGCPKWAMVGQNSSIDAMKDADIPTIFNPKRVRTPSVVVTDEESGRTFPNGPFGGLTNVQPSDSGGTTNTSNAEVPQTTATSHTILRKVVACKNSCCSPFAKKIYFGVCVTLCVTVTWVGATQCIKYLFHERKSLTPAFRSSNSSFQSSYIVSYDAPFFTTWFITNWTILFFPIFFVANLTKSKCESVGKIVGDSIRNFREKGFTAVRFFTRCSLFCLLWVATNYMYVHSLKILLATEVMALFATNVSCVYMLSWVILHEQFVGVRIVAVILCDTGIALLAYMDGINGSPTLGGVVLAACAGAGSAVYKVLFKKVIGEASYGQVSLFFSLIGLLNAALLWPLCLTLYFLGVEILYWNLLPWSALLGASLLSLAANLLGNFSCAVTYDSFITLGLITAVPVSAGLDVMYYNAKFAGMKLAGIILISIGFFLVMFPDNWPDYITRLLRNIILLSHSARWSRRNRNPQTVRRDAIDYRTGYIRSHLRSPSGRVR